MNIKNLTRNDILI